MPGTLPVLNKKALEYGIKAGLAMNCSISKFSKLDRKNFFYPDMPKAYQISQYDLPICTDGYVNIEVGEKIKKIGIERIHIEEDAGKLIHDPYGQGSLIDHNRCGVPLIEIVTRPDVRSPEEARILLETIKSILEYTGVSDCRMQEGSIRADVNLSIRPKGQQAFGTRTEMKNINSLRAVARAAEAEARRQAEILDKGGEVFQETRRWDDNKGESFTMRSKEEAMDYRYFPEPDLVPIVVQDSWLKEIKESIPELPQSRKERYIEELGIPPYDANLITMSKRVADIFETAAYECGNPKLASNWVMTDLLRRINEKGDSILDSALNGSNFGEILRYLEKGEITQASAKKVIDTVIETGENPRAIIEKLGLKIQRDESLIANCVKRAIEQNPHALSDYITGKEKAFGFLMGKVMADLRGKGDPAQVRMELTEELQSYKNRD
jgi:aspartyl-tRNA(Asn)/glutamyl-tRNA(Gln) amidotransferase subunit B